MPTFPYAVSHEVPLFLAPMAGVSESPFRRLCRRFGADVVVTEFLSAEGIRRENEATLSKLRFGPDERPIGVQIFGGEPGPMGEAAALVTDVFQPEFIDINFGCPVKKVVRRNGGSGCLKDLNLVQEVIRAVARSTHLPVTCKIRSGWNEEMRDPVTIGLRCQDAGVRAIALHPRTRTQMYSGAARWEEIAKLVDALDIPVIGNGDIKTATDAYRMYRETNCAGVMIARGSFGQPWIFDQTRALLAGKPLQFRKHLGWYVKGLPGSADLRKKLHQVNSFDEVEGIFSDYLAAGARGDLDTGARGDFEKTVDARDLDAELLEAEHA
jgi:tRNA-dihydrouridine synthase B